MKYISLIVLTIFISCASSKENEKPKKVTINKNEVILVTVPLIDSTSIKTLKK